MPVQVLRVLVVTEVRQDANRTAATEHVRGDPSHDLEQLGQHLRGAGVEQRVDMLLWDHDDMPSVKNGRVWW